MVNDKDKNLLELQQIIKLLDEPEIVRKEKIIFYKFK